jgi:hypothetical protein
MGLQEPHPQQMQSHENDRAEENSVERIGVNRQESGAAVALHGPIAAFGIGHHATPLRRRR